jgi:hypothetical protein
MAKLGTAKADFAKYRQLIGIAIAGIILSIIFVPFQSAEAFTVTIDLPDDDDGEITQSAAGEPFEITIDVEAGELISIESIQLILDNTQPSVKNSVFDNTGSLDGGSESLVINNVIEINAALTDMGYGYGYGSVSAGTTFNGPYSYSFVSNEDFIGGNTGGINNPGVTEFVTGLAGPGQIVISGTIRTADLAEDTHTLDVLIDTGANGIGNVDQLTATQFEFDVLADDDLETVEQAVGAGATSADVPIPGFEVGGEPIELQLFFGTPAPSAGTAIVTLQNPGNFFDAIADPDNYQLSEDGGNIVIDSDFIVAGLIADIDLSSLGFTSGVDSITIGLNYDDSAMSADEEEDVRLFHFDDDTDEWEALTNDDVTVNGGGEVDTDDNIVYGTTDDFSLFAPAFSSSTGGAGDDTGRVRAGGGQTVYVGILPESFLAQNPLLRFQVNSHGVFDANGERLTSLKSGQQVMLAGSFENKQGQPQDYAFIVQVIDEDGVTMDIGWLTGTLESQEVFEGSRSWTADDAGNYTVRVLIWNGIDMPVPLTSPSQDTIRVT